MVKIDSFVKIDILVKINSFVKIDIFVKINIFVKIDIFVKNVFFLKIVNFVKIDILVKIDIFVNIDLFVKLNKMLAEVIGKEKRSLFQNKVKSTCSAWEKIYDKNYDDAMLRKIRKLNETQVKQITIALKKYHDVVEESDAYGNAYQIRQRFNEAILKSKDKHFRPSKKRKSKQKKSSASSLMSSNSSFFINFMRIVLSFCLCYVS